MALAGGWRACKGRAGERAAPVRSPLAASRYAARMDEATIRDERRLWLLIAFASLATVAGLAAAGFTVRWQSVLPPLAGACGLHVVAVFYRTMRPEPRFAATCEALAQLVMFTVAGGPLSYLAASLAWPLQDARFAHWDAMLGVDFRAYIGLFDALPGPTRIVAIAYDTLMPQLAAALILLGLTGRARELRILVWAIVLSGLAAILFSSVVPALGSYLYLGIGPGDVPHIRPAAAFLYGHDLRAVRDGSCRTIDLLTLQGIITFPSYHAALAVIYGWGFWQSRAVRWPGLAFEALVIVSTPVEGGHYFVDVAAGALLAALAIVAARRLVAIGGERLPRDLAPHPAALAPELA